VAIAHQPHRINQRTPKNPEGKAILFHFIFFTTSQTLMSVKAQTIDCPRTHLKKRRDISLIGPQLDVSTVQGRGRGGSGGGGGGGREESKTAADSRDAMVSERVRCEDGDVHKRAGGGIEVESVAKKRLTLLGSFEKEVLHLFGRSKPQQQLVGIIAIRI
jgi:hypothetical protein